MIRSTALLPLAGLLLAACDAPDLEPTEGGYLPGMVPAAADTGLVAPHAGPAPLDTAGGAIETSPGAPADTTP